MTRYLGSTNDDLVLWFSLLVLAMVLALSVADPCERLTKGTDAYWECMTGEEIDLSVQDEADTVTSQTREEVTR